MWSQGLQEEGLYRHIRMPMHPAVCPCTHCTASLTLYASFCDKHRYAEDHNCIYDYQQYGRSVLSKLLPEVRADVLRDRV